MIDVEHAIKVLNELCAGDVTAMHNLTEYRTGCNYAFVAHPTVQIAEGKNGEAVVGLLGILNAIFGIRADMMGYIAAKYDDNGNLVGFCKTPE